MCWTWCSYVAFFFFNDTATTEIYTLSLHDALPISRRRRPTFSYRRRGGSRHRRRRRMARGTRAPDRSLTARRAYEPAAAPRHAAARWGAVQHQRHRRAPLADHGREPVRAREPGIVAARDGGLLPAVGDRRTRARRHRSRRGRDLSMGAARL